jgi:hypothetical protein
MLPSLSTATTWVVTVVRREARGKLEVIAPGGGGHGLCLRHAARRDIVHHVAAAIPAWHGHTCIVSPEYRRSTSRISTTQWSAEEFSVW